MDPLSQGHSMDDALPQSPSSCSLPTVYDLSRRRHHSPVNPTPVSALHLARAPRWCGTSSSGVDTPGNSSPPYRNSLSAQQVQPDNAFSNTTVTLSYINRSHVHSTQDQIAPKIHSVPSRAGGLMQRSPPDSKDRWFVSSAGREGAGCRVQDSNRQVGELLSQSEHLRAYSEASPVERVKGGQGGVVRFAQQTPGFNGKQEFLGPSRASSLQRCHVDSVVEGGNRFLQRRDGDQGRGVQNGVKTRLQRQSGREVAQRDQRSSRKLYYSLNEDFLSTLGESSSPGESSPDEMEDMDTLPQTLNSPSSDSPCLEEDIADVAGGKSVEEEGCKFMVQFVEVSSSPEDSCSDSDVDSDVIEVPVTNTLALLPVGLPQPFRKSPALEECVSKRTQLTHAVKKTAQKAPEEHLNGNMSGEESAVGRNKQPPHTRQEVIVRNITPLRSKTSSHTHSVEQGAQPENLAVHHVVSLASDGDSACDSEVEADHLSAAGLREGESGVLRSSRQQSQQSTSGSEDGSLSKSYICGTSSPGPPTLNEEQQGQTDVSLPMSFPQKALGKTLKRTKNQQKSYGKRSRTSSTAAQKRPCSKKRKKRKQGGQPSSFCQQEPEIKLKYATYREEKRDVRGVTFAPYVHLQNKEFSSCTVINYLEEETGKLKKGRPRQTGQGLATGAVPTTSYLELGRLDAEERRRVDQVCCLCGGSPNAIDLGDLHGPYRPPKGQQGPGVPSELQGPKDEEAGSDSDSSYDGRRGKCGCVQEGVAQPGRSSDGPKRDAALVAQCRWVCDEDSLQDPFAKMSWPVSSHRDQQSPPTELRDSKEFWLHEDCGVWSTGVFLVRGRLYGLEEAVRLAQGTVCSTCHELGATLGCFFKGCPNKYHYRCAVVSDCVLNEENFTMKCTKHKFCALAGGEVCAPQLGWNACLLPMTPPPPVAAAADATGKSNSGAPVLRKT